MISEIAQLMHKIEELDKKIVRAQDPYVPEQRRLSRRIIELQEVKRFHWEGYLRETKGLREARQQLSQKISVSLLAQHGLQEEQTLQVTEEFTDNHFSVPTGFMRIDRAFLDERGAVMVECRFLDYRGDSEREWIPIELASQLAKEEAEDE